MYKKLRNMYVGINLWSIMERNLGEYDQNIGIYLKELINIWKN